MAHTAFSFAGALAVKPVQHSPVIVGHPIVGHPIVLPQPPVASLPLANSGHGSLFLDRTNPNLHWYLPDFVLADDIDSSFAFVASQNGPMANNQPYNVARLTLRIRKLMPADVVQFAQANPTATLQEISLAEMTAILSSPYMDQNGQQQQRTFNATGFKDMGDSSFLLTFDGTIYGDSVVALYQDLRLFGKAIINLSASYQAWSKRGGPVLPSNFRLRMAAMPARNFAVAGASLHPPTPQVNSSLNMMRFREIQPFGPGTVAGRNAQPTPDQPPVFIQLRQSFARALPLGLKYNLDGYQLRYTVSTATVASHVILNANDLSGFTQSQSQFAELKALGDIGLNYPSLSRAYFGALSRTIVLIPRRYSIVRSKAGCAATCLARVDSSPASGSKCCFEFSFTIAPEVSRIEVDKLQQAILKSPDFNGYQLTFADFTQDSTPSTLLTTFKSTVQFAAGADAHTFAVTVSVQDDGASTPAVANANLFILRLCSQTGTDLLGSLSLKLDDGYPDSVLATIDLNFSHTVGTDELHPEFDEAAGSIKVTNQSPLDLQIEDYALVQGATLTEFPGPINIPAGGATSLSLPADHTNLQFVPVAQLALPTPMSLQSVTKYLNFQTVDVQETQYLVAIDASGVNYTKVASIAVEITFSTLPTLNPPQFNFNSSVRADSTHIVVPLENAMFSLPGSANMTVQFVDPSVSQLVFTIQNDFTLEPVLTLLQTDIDKHLPATP